MKVYAKAGFTVKSEGSEYKVYFMQSEAPRVTFNTLNEAICYVDMITII